MTTTLFISVSLMVLWISPAVSGTNITIQCLGGSSPPVITVDGATYSNGSNFTTTENVPRHIACTVSGGEPNVYAITLACGQHSITEYGTKADLLQTTFSKAENGQKCTCSASHVTGCYNLKTEITINVMYQPTVTSFTAVGKDTEVTIKQGDTINFNCTASGNPRPTMYITQRSPTSEPFITVQTYNLQYDIRGAQCDDTDVFYCVADNSVTSGAQATKQRSIQVYVTCPPEPIKSGEQTHTADLNSDATIMFEVTAYPVINMSLAILSVVKEKFLVPVDATRYSVSVVPGVPPKMTVVVTFKKVQQEDLLHYAVDLQNGLGSGATYYFSLQVPIEVKTFTVNGSKSIKANYGDSVVLHCEVTGSGGTYAVLSGPELSNFKTHTQNTAVIDQTLANLTCQDAGRYFCWGRNGGGETSPKDFVDVNITCLVEPPPVYQGKPYQPPKQIKIESEKNTTFDFVVYGYPEPTSYDLRIQTKDNSYSNVTSSHYKVQYIHQEPPFGLVTLTIYDENTKETITYVLGINSVKGRVEVTVEVVKFTNKPTDDTKIKMAIGIGVGVGGFLIVVVVIVVVCTVKYRRSRTPAGSRGMPMDQLYDKPSTVYNDRHYALAYENKIASDYDLPHN